ncbi:hypothetical protein [Bradyrhizobium sp. Gha]|uniref:hypothetical protein n=1 Tax=Bradyrhizobium sp. Gha TaxID=1855318 RepID=UPI0008E5DAF0|nr:hypothetical protein [Bradyrhizobium sp. Gha]SFH94906.1 hypothetical protein SAMN05216525_10341 [Bradyrhizobium sp. Gha]
MKTMMFAVAATAFWINSDKSAWAAEPDPIATFASSFGAQSKCAMVLPTAAQTTRSSNRIGAIAQYQTSNGKPYDAETENPTQIVTMAESKPWCAPKSWPLPVANDYQGGGTVDLRQRVIDAGVDFNVTLNKVFNLVDLTANYVDAVAYGVDDLKYFLADTGDQKDAIRSIISRGEDCAESLASQKSQMVYRICTGTIKLGVYYKREVKGSLVDLTLSALKVNFDVHFLDQLSSVKPCKNDAPAAPSKPAAAVAPATKGAAATSKPASTTVTPEAVGAAVAAALTAMSKDQSANTGAAPAPKATDTPAKTSTASPDPQKCYDIAYFTSSPNAVIGVRLSATGTGDGSVAALVKAVTKKPETASAAHQ